jgi:hypothetical protein
MKRAILLFALGFRVAWAQAPQPALKPEAPTPAPAPAPAPDPPPSVGARAPSEKVFLIGAHVGMGFPQLFSKLRNFGVYELELGYLLPVWERRVQIGGAFSYSEPGSGNGRPDPRLATASGDYRWDLSNRELVLEVNVLIRAFPPGSFIVPYGKVGFRVYLLDTEISGASAGNPFGVYNEKFTEPGFVVGGGIEIRLGPGAFNAELRVDYSEMNRRISGDSNTGMLTLLVGYRFLL